jgi:hypothetical protein
MISNCTFNLFIENEQYLIIKVIMDVFRRFIGKSDDCSELLSHKFGGLMDYLHLKK